MQNSNVMRLVERVAEAVRQKRGMMVDIPPNWLNDLLLAYDDDLRSPIPLETLAEQALRDAITSSRSTDALNFHALLRDIRNADKVVTNG